MAILMAQKNATSRVTTAASSRPDEKSHLRDQGEDHGFKAGFEDLMLAAEASEVPFSKRPRRAPWAIRTHR